MEKIEIKEKYLGVIMMQNLAITGGGIKKEPVRTVIEMKNISGIITTEHQNGLEYGGVGIGNQDLLTVYQELLMDETAVTEFLTRPEIKIEDKYLTF